MQHFFLTVKAIEIGDPSHQTPMRLHVQQVPIQARVMIPLPPLTKLTSHEDEFLPGLRKKIPEEHP